MARAPGPAHSPAARLNHDVSMAMIRHTAPAGRHVFARGLVVLALALFAALAVDSSALADPVVVAAGDIACGSITTDGNCAQQDTSDLVSPIGPDAVLALGDNQYETASLADFNSYYGPTWGRFKSITRPVAGNHEYRSSGAGGYFDYFDGVGANSGPAGDRGAGYYSWDLGSWHMIALNSEQCVDQSGCAAGSAQEQWLRADLAANPASCTLAYMHHPRWSSDTTVRSTPEVAPLVQALYDYHADLMLTGHAHTYERFGPQDPSGAADTDHGLVEIIAGTGGKSEFSFGDTPLANSVAHAKTLGVLELTLHSSSYDWTFVPAAGQTFTDSGAALCNRSSAADTDPPAAPSGLGATAGDSSVSLSWDANHEPDLYGYDVYRSTSADGPYEKVTSSPVTATSYTDDALSNDTTYHYVVKALDPSGNVSEDSNEASATPTSEDSGPEATTDPLSAVSRKSATLKGRVDPHGHPTSWRFEYGRTKAYGARTSSQDAGDGNGSQPVSAPVSGLRKKKTYHYRLVASWSDGAVTRGADVAFRPPSAERALGGGLQAGFGAGIDAVLRPP